MNRIKLFTLIVVFLITSCEESDNNRKIVKNRLVIDSLNSAFNRKQLQIDSLKYLLSKEKGRFISDENFFFIVKPIHDCQLRKGQDIIVETNVVLIPDSSSFWVVAGKLDTRTQKFQTMTDTLFPTKKSQYQSVLINSSTLDDTIGINEIYYRLFFEFKKDLVVEKQIKLQYEVHSDSPATSTTRPEHSRKNPE